MIYELYKNLFRFEKIKKIITFFADYPCPLCGKAMPAECENLICSQCKANLPLVRKCECPGCGAEIDGILEVCSNCAAIKKTRPWKKAFTSFRMEEPVNSLIINYKFKNKPELVRALSDFIPNEVYELNLDFIVPVPLHWTRYLRRGFNQSELIAGRISAKTGTPIKKILKRHKKTNQQSKLGFKERQKNLIDAFSVKKTFISEKCSILLIDDVLTTGATLSSASEVCKEAGIEEIYVLTLARR